MARRRKNPKPLTVVLVAAAVGAAVYGIARVVKAKPPKKVKGNGNGAALPDTSGGGAPSKKNNYVGSGWTGWPHKDTFGNEQAFGQALTTLGYSAGDTEQSNWSALSGSAMGAVGQYQDDWNIVRQAGTMKQNMRLLTVDELIGTDTANSLYESLELEALEGVPSWMTIVEASRGAVS